MRLLIIYNVLIYSRLHSDWRTWSCPPSPVPPPPDAPAQREEKRVKRPHHASHEPLRRFSPTDKARSRQRRARFQNRTTSSMPSCRATQYFTSVRYQLQPQTCTPFPRTHTTPPRQFSPTATENSRQRRVRFQHRAASSLLLYRAPQHFTPVGYQLQLQTCTPFTPPNTTLIADLCRQLRRNPDRGGCGFSITSPQTCHYTERLIIFTSVGYRFCDSSRRRHRRINSSSWR